MIQKVLFDKGLNTDVTPELNKGFPFLENVRILSTNDGNDLSVTTVNGNTLVPLDLPDSGSYKCIGYYSDKLQKKGYYFVWGRNSHCFIAEYDQTLNTIQYVLKDNSDGVELNFNTDYLIQAVVVELDADNHLLYFTDNYNEPRKLNIEKAKYYTAGNHTLGYTSPFDIHWVDRIKTPPDAPTYEWSYVGNTLFTDAYATSSSFFTLSATPTDYPLPYPTAVPAIGYNPLTSIFTVPLNGYYSSVVSIVLNTSYSGSPVTANVRIAIVNFVTSSVIAYSDNIVEDSDGYKVIGCSFSNTLLTATDQYFIQITIDGTVEETLTYAASGGLALNYWSINYIGVTLDSFNNNLFKRLFQFQCQWIYDDKEPSVLSEKTNYILPVTGQNSGITSTGEDYYSQDNVITISLPTGSSIVKKIKVYAQELNQTLPSLVTILDKDELGIDDDTFYDFIFLNDGNYVPVDETTATQLFDYVFYKEQALEYFKTRLGDANGTEGADSVSVDMRFPVSYDQTVQTNPNSSFPARSYYKAGSIYEEGIVYKYNGKRLSNASTAVGVTTVMNPSNGVFGTQLHIPFLTQLEYTAPTSYPDRIMEYIPTVSSYIYHRPPPDAIGYSIIRSKSQNITRYIQFVSQGLTYRAQWNESGDAPIVSPALAFQIEVDIGNIVGRYKTENSGSRLVYDWAKGDRIRFIADTIISGYSNTTIGTRYTYNDNEVIGYNASTGKLYLLVGNAPLTMGTNILFEIYTPAKNITNDNELVYEVGEGGTIIDDEYGNKVHKPNDNGRFTVIQRFNTFDTSNYDAGFNMCFGTTPVGQEAPLMGANVKVIGSGWSIYGKIIGTGGGGFNVDTTGFTMWGAFRSSTGTIVACSEQDFTSGDCFRRYCDMPWVAGHVYRLYQYIETMDASNMWSSQAWDYGRPNRIDNNAKRSVNKSRVRYTQQIIPYTNINGLSTIYDLNFEDYSPQFGGINKLFYQNERLQAYQELKVLPILVQQQVIQSPEGQGNLTTSPAVLYPQQKIDYYLQDFGIGEHFESWAYYGNSHYFFDVKRSAIVRLAQDGLVDISTESKIRTLIADVCQKILRCEYKVNCVGVYDVRFGEYILMISPFTYDTDKTFGGLTIAFNEKYNQFTSTYSYNGDYIGQTGIDILSFNGGKLYTHNDNVLQNNFYGTQGSSIIWCYLNDNHSKVKVIQALAQEGIYPFAVVIETIAGQYTHLLDSNFEQKEGNWYSPIFRDEHTPNVVASPPNPQYLPDAIFEGNPMRDRTFLYKFQYGSSDYNKMFAINQLYTTSERSDK